MSDESTEPKSPFAKRGFLFAAIGVGAIGLAAVVAITAAIVGGGGDPAPTPAPTPSAPTVSAEDMSVCGLAGFEAESSLATAPDTSWELVGTVAAPTDPKGAGPGVLEDDGFRSCYAHTAEGALYFAVNYIAIGTDATIRNRLPELVEPGPGRDALIAAGEASAGDETSSQRAQVAGFKVAAYSGSAATIDLALNYSDGRLISAPIKLVWADGDWKLVLTEAGQLPLAPGALENLGGYIPWAGA
jgi:hypothetical protein